MTRTANWAISGGFIQRNNRKVHMKMVTWTEKMIISSSTSLCKWRDKSSLVMGIEVGKSSAINPNTKKVLPSHLNTYLPKHWLFQFVLPRHFSIWWVPKTVLYCRCLNTSCWHLLRLPHQSIVLCRKSFLLTFAVPASFLECLLPHLGRPAATWLIQIRIPWRVPHIL